MYTLELMAMAMAGVGLIAALSFTMYSALPNAAFDMAAEHGRYSGLGIAGARIDQTPGNRRDVRLGSLQGHSA